jgi:subfamily B ATP-binding cassette protein MsbA
MAASPKKRWQLLSTTDRRVYSYFRKHAFAMVFATMCAMMGGALGTAPIWILKKFISTILASHDVEALWQLALAIVFLTTAAAAAQYGQNFILRAVGFRVVQEIRSELVRTYQFLSIDFFRDQKAGDLTSRVVADSSVVQLAVQGVVDFFNEPFKLAALTISAIVLSPKLAGLFVLVLPITVVITRRINRAIRRYSKRTQTGMGQAAGLITESIAGAREVRAFGLEQQQIDRFEAEHDIALRMAYKGARATAIGPSIVMLIGALSSAIIIYVGGRMVMRGQTTIDNLLAFLVAVGLCYDPIRRLNRVAAQLAMVAGAAERIFVMLDQRPTVVDTGKGAAPADVSTVAFDDVSFAYGERVVLDRVALEARRGEVIALVGESGSGKTTLVSLLPRFYDPARGAVRINGSDIRDFTIASLRERVAIVSQDTFLFNDTVKNNIRLGNLSATDEQIVAAAQAAYADGFVRALPQGYDTMLGERGTGLSGGQRQRIAIARAILRDAPVLVLDEATSALDSESEVEVQKALERLMADRTAFVVAHRLSTIRNADRIVVLSGGKIVEIGNHTDLYERGGEYRRLHEIQFRSGSSVS